MRAYTQGKSHARPSALAASKVKEREFLRPANELLLRSGSALPPKKLVFRVACAIFCLYSGAYYLVYSCCTSDFNWRTLLTVWSLITRTGSNCPDKIVRDRGFTSLVYHNS